ncbi:MAG: FAD-binding oxidoreductase [Deltaproteobacteria bacterium]|nr:FAD-binding oxidoreductase [Deltaproteobacteria bacterium]
MRRWNGWGDENFVYPLPKGAADFLVDRVGPATPRPEATLDDVAAKVPHSRLAPHPLIRTEPKERVRHACGQSLGDWIALRSGEIAAFPDGVAYPSRREELDELIRHARNTDACVIPYGGGSSVVGHINPIDARPSICVDMARLDRLIDFDETSQQATFGAGIMGPALESLLRERGFMLGHYPQSFEFSTLGGWIAARSSGQQSACFGRIERLFAGGRVHTPMGELVLPCFPASAAGPDLKEQILGSEGRIGIVSEATVRVTRLPEVDTFHAVFFPDWERATQGCRAIAQAQLPYSMLRLSTAVETETMLALAGHGRLMRLLELALSVRGAPQGRCMLMMGFTGRRDVMRKARKAALSIARSFGGVDAGRLMGRQWSKSRFRAPYLRNSLWEAGYAIDTLETATSWAKVPATVADIDRALRHTLDPLGEKVHAFTHLSHVYPTGSSIYSTYLFRIAEDPSETRRRWKLLKDAASKAIVSHGGTISHQHGVGIDHMPYLQAEKGDLGMEAIRKSLRFWDPDRVMNPGKLISD